MILCPFVFSCLLALYACFLKVSSISHLQLGAKSMFQFQEHWHFKSDFYQVNESLGPCLKNCQTSVHRWGKILETWRLSYWETYVPQWCSICGLRHSEPRNKLAPHQGDTGPPRIVAYSWVVQPVLFPNSYFSYTRTFSELTPRYLFFMFLYLLQERFGLVP